MMRSKQHLKETFNKVPRPESAIQNQYLLLEVLCDIRDMLYSKQDKGFVAPFDDEPEQKDLRPEGKIVGILKIEEEKEPEQKSLKPIDEPI